VRERGQIDIVRSATCVDKGMAIRPTADIGGKAVNRFDGDVGLDVADRTSLQS